MESNNGGIRLFNKIWQSVAETWESLKTKEDRPYIVGGSLYSGTHVSRIFGFDVHTITALANNIGVISNSVITAVLINVALKIVKKKLYPKIKFLKDESEKKDDNERAA
jgi:hypothetical protein